MKVKLITQRNLVTGQVNVTFLTDPTSSAQDCLVDSGTWADSEVIEEEVLLLGGDAALDALQNNEFRSVLNSEGEPVVLPIEEALALRDKMVDYEKRRLQDAG